VIDDKPAPSPPRSAPSRPSARELPDHPVRVALLDLLAERGTLTSTEAAARLGQSSGLCSFHLRQLARHGLVEEAPRSGGRARPWQLRWERPGEDHHPGSEPGAEPADPAGASDVPARGPEGEGRRRLPARRERTPREWRAGEAYSTVVHLTPQELHAVAEAVRQTLTGYRAREHDAAARPPGARPVAFESRLFPLPPGTGGTGGTGDDGEDA
jgi:hypothetical protein